MPQIDIIQHPEKIDWFMPWSDQIKEEFGTAKANRLSPFDYIEYILEIMPQIDIIQHPEKIDWFMPWSDQIKEEFGIKDD